MDVAGYSFMLSGIETARVDPRSLNREERERTPPTEDLVPEIVVRESEIFISLIKIRDRQSRTTDASPDIKPGFHVSRLRSGGDADEDHT
jgi:hypothetical protein